MNIPFTAVHFSAYETAKRLIDKDGDEETLVTQLLAGGAAGGLSAACTNPLDVVKTRLQTDGMLKHRRHLHSSDVVRSLMSLSKHRPLCVSSHCASRSPKPLCGLAKLCGVLRAAAEIELNICRCKPCETSSRLKDTGHCGMACQPEWLSTYLQPSFAGAHTKP
jgi:Mitochondrial carrier protein